MAGGRPTKLNDDLCQKIIDNIKEGIPPATAAELTGISKRTYERWLQRGREAKRKTQYTEFCRKIESAKAYAEKKHLHRIMESKDWKAQKYLLTLLNKEYALPDKLEVESKIDAKVDVKKTEENVFVRLDRILDYIKDGDDEDGNTTIPDSESETK